MTKNKEGDIKMKAIVRTSLQNDHLTIADVPIPKINKDEVLIEVKAFGVGIQERYFIPKDIEVPYPIGSEAAGVIVKTGNEVKDFHIGNRVILSSSLQNKGGCWAEYVAVSSRSIVLMSDSISFEEGAALPVAGKTALECMRMLDLKEDTSLFIAGASGAIGTMVIQMAKSKGIRVIGSASSKNHEYMRSLGAIECIDYTDTDWKEQVARWAPNGLDAALAIQPGTVKDSIDVVKNGGKVIVVSGDSFVPKRNISVTQVRHQTEFKQAISDLMEQIDKGTLRVVIERIYPFELAIEALMKTETRHARGKLVVSTKNLSD